MDLRAGTSGFATQAAEGLPRRRFTVAELEASRKAALYASFGIPELWVIRAVRLETRIHREPSPAGYRFTLDLASNHELVPAFAPGLAVTLSGLDLR
jgi:Uma2 family endonuclease